MQLQLNLSALLCPQETAFLSFRGVQKQKLGIRIFEFKKKMLEKSISDIPVAGNAEDSSRVR